MVKFLKAPKIPKYTGKLEMVSYCFLVPVEKHPRTQLTGFQAISWPIRKLVAGLQQKPMSFWGCEFLGCKRVSVKRSELPKKTEFEPIAEK